MKVINISLGGFDMRINKIKLASQLFFKSLVVFLILVLYIVSRANFGFNQYHNIISKIYYSVLVLYGLTGFIKQEKVDELAEKILYKVNNIVLVVVNIGLFLLAILVAAPMYSNVNVTRDVIGLLILILLFIITTLKASLFYYYNRKGL